MADYLSPAWFSAVRERVASMVLTPHVPGPGFDIAVTITRADTESITYRLSLSGDTVTFDAPVDDHRPEVRIEVDSVTAARVAAADLSAQRAFMAGDLRVTGEVTLLIEHSAVLDSIGPLFGSPESV